MTARPPEVPSLPDLRRPVAYAVAQGPCCGHGAVIPITARGTADPPIPVGGTPTAIAVTPDAATVLVANAAGYVSVIDTASSTRRSDIPVCDWARGIAVTPDGATAFVSCEHSSTVEPIDLATGRVGDPIGVGQQPGAIVITPDGKTAYVVNFNGTSPSDPNGTVTPISVATHRTGPAIRLYRREAESAAVTPDGRSVFVGVRDTCCTTSVHRIDTATNTATETLPECAGPSSIAVTRDGSTAYFACRFGNEIVARSLNGGSAPPPRRGIATRALAVSPDGTTLYSANGLGEVDILDTATMQVRGFVPADTPVAVAVTPQIRPVVVPIP
jgi:DNA-binding beta-propeller fold protein YncE